jgi:hypothetical protein
VTEIPPGSPGDLTIHIRELCLIARVHTVYYYTQVKEGKARKPRRGRIPLREAIAWLERRAEKYSDRAAAVERLRNRLSPEALAAVGAKEGA